MLPLLHSNDVLFAIKGTAAHRFFRPVHRLKLQFELQLSLLQGNFRLLARFSRSGDSCVYVC
jgi:hypothetical protein